MDPVEHIASVVATDARRDEIHQCMRLVDEARKRWCADHKGHVHDTIFRDILIRLHARLEALTPK